MIINFKKLFNAKKSKWFWVYIVLGVIITILSIMLMPFWEKFGNKLFFYNWGKSIVKLIICGVLVLYLLGYLLKKVLANGNGVIKILTIVEFVLLSLIALSCILSQFNVIKISGACKILGLVLWLRGSIEIFRAYYYQKGSEMKYNVFYLIIALILVTLGVYFFVSGVIKDVYILWLFVILLLAIGVLFIVDGIIKNPKLNK